MDFNPRSPCGERLGDLVIKQDGAIFQSTLPVRGATRRHALYSVFGGISIHAPRAGSDPQWGI